MKVAPCVVSAVCYWRSPTQVGFEVKGHAWMRKVYMDDMAGALKKIKVGTKVKLSLSKHGEWSVGK